MNTSLQVHSVLALISVEEDHFSSRVHRWSLGTASTSWSNVITLVNGNKIDWPYKGN